MRAADYIEETTTSIAGTSGDGAVTLTALTNIPRFSSAFGTGATIVRYVIEDTVNKKFETGVGSVSSNVLTRTKPLTTWDGTTWDSTAPAALQFGATPTSGDVRVRIAAVAESSMTALPGVNNTVGTETWRDYLLCAAATWYGSGAGSAPGNGTENYQVFLLNNSGRLNGVRADVWTSVAGGFLKCALYSMGSTGLPEQKIVDFNGFDCSSTGVKSDTTTSTWSTGGEIGLTPGWYAIGYIANSGTIQLRGSAGSSNTQRTPYGWAGFYGYSSNVQKAGNYTTGLPAQPNLSGATLVTQSGNGSRHWLALRVQP